MPLWKVKVKLLVDKVSNLFGRKKKRSFEPKFTSPIYNQRKVIEKKPLGSHAIVILLPIIRECGVVACGDLIWLINRTRRQSSDDVWAEAVERMRQDSK